MKLKTVRYEQKGRVAVITLNRPEKLNAQNRQLTEDFLHALEQASQDANVGAVLVRGEGRAFCAGHDLTENTAPLNEELEAVEVLQNVTRSILGMGKPVVAAVHGYALGLGCEWAMNCDMIIAAEETIFGFPEVSIGGAVGNGGTRFLPLLIGLARAKEMILTGRRIDAREAEEWGLVNKVVPFASLFEEAFALASKIAENPPLAAKVAKNALNQALYLDFEEVLQSEMKDMVLTTYSGESGESADRS